MFKKFFSWVELVLPFLFLAAIAAGFFVPVITAMLISGQNSLFFYLIPMASVYFLRSSSLRDNFVNLLVVWGFAGFLLLNLSMNPSQVADVWGMWIPAAIVSVIRFLDWALSPEAKQ